MVGKGSKIKKDSKMYISPEELSWNNILNKQYFFLPKRTWIYFPYAEIPLYEIGFSFERLFEIMRGEEPTIEEQSKIRWAILLTRAVSEAVNNVNKDNELDFIIEAGKIAGERLDNERANCVIRGLRKIITDTPLVEWYRQKHNERIERIFKGLGLKVI